MGKKVDENGHGGVVVGKEAWKRVKVGGVVKVTYITRPVLVRTCHASQFRSLVHQLTGKDSDEHGSHYDNCNATMPPLLLDHHQQQQQQSYFFDPSLLHSSPPSSMDVFSLPN
ncbi:hypothetical protein PIB30_018041 [Stylosanthes scabra]|uniref:VQ domain-containing protein n=1 Tax=Stylosanthes scabra TaxID=79078 RepID=A0ABU6W6H1_9FABA|nr:hypothetical protein [Stylosanthes scabra]